MATSKRIRLFSATGLLPLLIAAFLLLPASAPPAFAHSVTEHTYLDGGPRFSVSAGFDTRYRDGNWIPVVVSLSNSGSDFNGTLSITTNPSLNSPGNSRAISHYQQPVSLANGAQKQITMYIPLSTGVTGTTQSISITLLNSNGQTVGKQISTLNAVGTGDIFVGVLSDLTSGFAPLNAVPLPNQGGAMIVEQLSAATMPTLAETLKNFDVIVLDNFTTANLSQDQFNALDIWINQGGTLIEVGGPEWHRTLSPLPSDLLPVNITGVATVPAGTALLPIGGPSRGGMNAQATVPNSVQAPVPVSTASLVGAQATPLLSAATTPLIVQAKRGQGTVSYLAFDPALEPVAGWAGASMLWKGLLLRNLGDQLLSSSNSSGYYTPQGQFIVGGMSNLLQTLMPNTLPSPWLLLIPLVGYLMILGPVRLIVVRWRHKRSWSWRIVLASIVVFSLLTYTLALQEKGTSILSDSVSIVQLNTNGGPAHETTYLGVFVPNQGDFQVHLPGNMLAQPSPDDFNSGISTSQQTTFSPTSDGTNIDLQGVDIWTLRSILAERDRQMHGGIVSHLEIVGNILKGTISNTLPYSLSDVYVLMTNSFAHINHLGAGQTVQVNAAMNPSSNNNNAGMPLATQIALSVNGGQMYYGSNNGQPLTETQRHLAILSTFSGQGYGIYSAPLCGGGPCKSFPAAPAVMIGNSGISYTSSSSINVIMSGSGSSLMSYGGDPLLVPGAPATLIGWADSPTDSGSAVTINGITPSGLAETLVQAPLAVTFSGTLNLPPNYVTGQLIDVESKGNTVQLEAPGIYTLSTGSMTFECTLPTTRPQVSSMTVSEPQNLQQVVQSNSSGSPANVNQIQVFLYNWQANSWDAYTMQNYAFYVNNTAPYIGPNGRVLVQFLNTDSTLGSIILAKPSLSLQGTAT